MTLISILIKKLEPNIKQREKKLVVEEIAVNKRSSENREQKKKRQERGCCGDRRQKKEGHGMIRFDFNLDVFSMCTKCNVCPSMCTILVCTVIVCLSICTKINRNCLK